MHIDTRTDIEAGCQLPGVQSGGQPSPGADHPSPFARANSNVQPHQQQHHQQPQQPQPQHHQQHHYYQPQQQQLQAVSEGGSGVGSGGGAPGAVRSPSLASRQYETHSRDLRAALNSLVCDIYAICVRYIVASHTENVPAAYRQGRGWKITWLVATALFTFGLQMTLVILLWNAASLGNAPVVRPQADKLWQQVGLAHQMLCRIEKALDGQGNQSRAFLALPSVKDCNCTGWWPDQPVNYSAAQACLGQPPDDMNGENCADVMLALNSSFMAYGRGLFFDPATLLPQDDTNNTTRIKQTTGLNFMMEKMDYFTRIDPFFFMMFAYISLAIVVHQEFKQAVWLCYLAAGCVGILPPFFGRRPNKLEWRIKDHDATADHIHPALKVIVLAVPVLQLLAALAVLATGGVLFLFEQNQTDAVNIIINSVALVFILEVDNRLGTILSLKEDWAFPPVKTKPTVKTGLRWGSRRTSTMRRSSSLRPHRSSSLKQQHSGSCNRPQQPGTSCLKHQGSHQQSMQQGCAAATQPGPAAGAASSLAGADDARDSNNAAGPCTSGGGAAADTLQQHDQQQLQPGQQLQQGQPPSAADAAPGLDDYHMHGPFGQPVVQQVLLSRQRRQHSSASSMDEGEFDLQQMAHLQQQQQQQALTAQGQQQQQQQHQQPRQQQQQHQPPPQQQHVWGSSNSTSSSSSRRASASLKHWLDSSLSALKSLQQWASAAAERTLQHRPPPLQQAAATAASIPQQVSSWPQQLWTWSACCLGVLHWRWLVGYGYMSVVGALVFAEVCFLAPQSAAQMLSFVVLVFTNNGLPDGGAPFGGIGVVPQFMANPQNHIPDWFPSTLWYYWSFGGILDGYYGAQSSTFSPLSPPPSPGWIVAAFVLYGICTVLFVVLLCARILPSSSHMWTCCLMVCQVLLALVVQLQDSTFLEKCNKSPLIEESVRSAVMRAACPRNWWWLLVAALFFVMWLVMFVVLPPVLEYLMTHHNYDRPPNGISGHRRRNNSSSSGSHSSAPLAPTASLLNDEDALVTRLSTNYW